MLGGSFQFYWRSDDGRKLMVKDPGKIIKMQGGRHKEAASQSEKKTPLVQDHKKPDHKKETTHQPTPKKEK